MEVKILTVVINSSVTELNAEPPDFFLLPSKQPRFQLPEFLLLTLAFSVTPECSDG